MGTNDLGSRVSYERLRRRSDAAALAWPLTILVLGACVSKDDPQMQQLLAGSAALPASNMSPATGTGTAGAEGTPPAPTGTAGAGVTPPPAPTGTAGAPAPIATAGAAAPVDPGTAGTSASAGGAGGAPVAGSSAPPVIMDLGVGDGSDVVTMGDSWMNLGFSGIEQSLRAAGKNYRGYAVAGTTLAGSIPGQFTSAVRANPNISTVIMTGGGNDIMFSGGCNTAEACAESVKMLVARLNELWTTMADAGVKNVVYINYSRDAGTTPDSTRPTTPPDPAPICLSGRIRCHSMPTTDLVMGQLLDGIHPTSAANGRIVEALLKLMETQGIRR